MPVCDSIKKMTGKIDPDIDAVVGNLLDAGLDACY